MTAIDIQKNNMDDPFDCASFEDIALFEAVAYYLQFEIRFLFKIS